MLKEKYLLKKECTVKEVFEISYAREASRISLYQDTRLNFLSFNPGISRLMKELENESEARIERLAEVAKSLQLLEALASSNRTMVREKPHRRHFFIVNMTMATDVLEQVWQHEYRTQCFYECLKAGSFTADLDRLLTAFIRQARNQAHMLQEAKGEIFLQGQWRRDQGMFKRIV